LVDETPEALTAAEAPPPLARRDMTEELKKLFACLGRLDPEKQRIVLLAYYSGWSREQLAEKLDIPMNTIKTWLRRSLLEIHACLGS
jgi:RNA polymerase sigma-70 factor, ECF subfamily